MPERKSAAQLLELITDQSRLKLLPLDVQSRLTPSPRVLSTERGWDILNQSPDTEKRIESTADLIATLAILADTTKGLSYNPGSIFLIHKEIDIEHSMRAEVFLAELKARGYRFKVPERALVQDIPVWSVVYFRKQKAVSNQKSIRALKRGVLPEEARSTTSFADYEKHMKAWAKSYTDSRLSAPRTLEVITATNTVNPDLSIIMLAHLVDQKTRKTKDEKIWRTRQSQVHTAAKTAQAVRIGTGQTVPHGLKADLSDLITGKTTLAPLKDAPQISDALKQSGVELNDQTVLELVTMVFQCAWWGTGDPSTETQPEGMGLNGRLNSVIDPKLK